MVFSQNITPDHLDVQWDIDAHCRVDIALHSVRAPEGNPAFVIRNSGDGGMGRDKREPWVAGQPFNVLANWLLQQTIMPCDVWSVSTPQSHWGNPVSAAHLSTTSDERMTRPVLFPESVYWLKTFFQWANRFAVGGEVHWQLGTTLGHKAGDYVGVGRGFGALLQAVACFSGPRPPATSNGQLIPGTEFGPYGTTSAIKALVLHDLPIDVRNLAGVEQLYWFAMRGLFGTYETIAEWQSVPQWVKAQASPLAYVQRGETRFMVPQYLVGTAVGNRIHPFGDPATGAGSDIRDAQQWSDYNVALAAVVPPSVRAGEIIVDGAWETELAGAAISQRVLDFCRLALNR